MNEKNLYPSPATLTREQQRGDGKNMVIGTWVGGTAFEAHTARSYMDRDGDVERVDMNPEINVHPYAIDSRVTIG
ncbi:hypothetical protein F1880_005255 [Penicillium rolfsii]|nr:hypothetical protein F1880_005255 [Penicillium rolfsii]